MRMWLMFITFLASWTLVINEIVGGIRSLYCRFLYFVNGRLFVSSFLSLEKTSRIIWVVEPFDLCLRDWHHLLRRLYSLGMTKPALSSNCLDGILIRMGYLSLWKHPCRKYLTYYALLCLSYMLSDEWADYFCSAIFLC